VYFYLVLLEALLRRSSSDVSRNANWRALASVETVLYHDVHSVATLSSVTERRQCRFPNSFHDASRVIGSLIQQEDDIYYPLVNECV